MNRNAIVNVLRAVERVRAERVEIWRVIVASDGSVLRRVYSGSFNAPPGSRVGEPQQRKGA